MDSTVNKVFNMIHLYCFFDGNKRKEFVDHVYIGKYQTKVSIEV